MLEARSVVDDISRTQNSFDSGDNVKGVEDKSDNVKGVEDKGVNVIKGENYIDSRDATKEAMNILESQETKVVLDKMKNIENFLNNISNDKLDIYKGIILEYKSIKDDIKKKMEEDSNFQEAMKQVGEHLDKNDQPLNTIGEPKAGEMALDALSNTETQKQLDNAKYVISGYDRLNSNQKKVLDKGLKDFKDRIENVATQLGLNQ